MATVSILIPAYKPRHLARAIASALTQSFTDIEILVGDDTPDARLAELVKGGRDPRLQYYHHGFQKGARNLQALWERASGKYVKVLFDDDLLMPTSVESLVAALRENPDSVMAFHERLLIDENDNVCAMPPRLLEAGHTARLDRELLVAQMVCGLNNFIGEPSNVMFDRERFDFLRLFNYRSVQLNFLGDAATYLNASEQAPIIAVGGYLSAFRRHAEQASNPTGPHFSAGLYEWELIVRGEAAAGHLDAASLEGARQRLRRLYGPWAHALPEIARFAANLDELVERDPRTLLDSPRFQADLAHARRAVTARISARRNSSASAQKYCVICESPVDEWLPHPDAGSSSKEFMRQMGAVGSTLQNHSCPRCKSNDRERHLWLYMTRANLLADVAHKRVLHIAPEAGVERKIRALAPLEYVTGDLSPRRPEHKQINAEHIGYPDGHFDLILCNHVLEHVERPDRAMAELSRVLSANGHLVVQTPYSPILRDTLELTIPPSESFAVRYYGQNDHVRLFGADLVERLRAAGLYGDLYPHTTVLGDLDPDAWGCNGREPFFLFAKNGEPKFMN